MQKIKKKRHNYTPEEKVIILKRHLLECIRPKTPLSLDDARRIVAEYIEYYNTVRLHSAIGYIAPADKLEGRDKEIFKERDRKLEAAREQRKLKRQQVYDKIEMPGLSGCPLTQPALLSISV